MSNAYRELTLPAQVDRLPEVLSLIEEQLELAGCPMKTQIQLSVAAEEVFVNIASYAYAPASGMATIRMEYVEETSTVSLTFIDSGKAFNPLERPDPDLTAPAEKRDIGGLGIYMTKKSMDDVRYERRDGQNILTLVKRI